MELYTNDKISYFIKLGKRLKAWEKGEEKWPELDEAIKKSAIDNPFFTPFMQHYAINSLLSTFLNEEALEKWYSSYEKYFSARRHINNVNKKIAIVMAGNIPLVGFHDLMCVIISGAIPIVKMSSKDRYLFPVLFPQIKFSTNYEILDTPIDALITMGSDKTAGVLSYKFRNIPTIIRGTRFSYAIIKGNETHDELLALADDMLLYFGLGCRSVQHLFVPDGYDFSSLISAINSKEFMVNTPFFINSYRQAKALNIVEGNMYIDAKPLILIESHEIFTSYAVVNFERYNNADILDAFYQINFDIIQKKYDNFGQAQKPSLDDYPDGIDTMKFLFDL